MARVTRLVIGEDNFTETACGFCFTASVCEPTEEIDDSHIRVRRLLALFPGTTVETVLSKPAPKEPEKKKPETKVEGPKPGDAKAGATAPEADAKPEPAAKAAPEKSTVGTDDAEVTAKLEAAAAEDHAAKADTEATKDKVAEAAPVKASDETGELEAVGEVVPAEGQDDAADAGAEGPGGE